MVKNCPKPLVGDDAHIVPPRGVYLHARLNGMRPGPLVGDDAHIVPPRSDKIHARLNGKTLRYKSIPPSHSTYRGGPVRFRDDVGIVPYDHDRLHPIQRTAVVP